MNVQCSGKNPGVLQTEEPDLEVWLKLESAGAQKLGPIVFQLNVVHTPLPGMAASYTCSATKSFFDSVASPITMFRNGVDTP